MADADMRLRVLIVEDELIIADGFSEYLDSLGHEVVGIEETGKGAVERARRKKPDLVLMDITLKDRMDGIEAAERIREFDESVHIYLFSAYSAHEFRDRLKNVKDHVYMQKPVTLDDLDVLLSDIMENRSV